MGHSWPGEISLYGADVLQKLQRGYASVRSYAVQHLRRDQELGEGATTECGGDDGASLDRQQVRSGTTAPS